MRDLRVQDYEQIEAYTLIDLLSNVYFLALLNIWTKQERFSCFPIMLCVQCSVEWII